MDEKEIKLPSFDEDSFDLSAHKKAADTVTREKAREKRSRRQVVLGKVLIAVLAFGIFFLLYYMATEVIALF